MLGSGILKGMAVTAENFARSFVDKEHLTTVSYPEERSTVTAFSRNLPFLVYDGENEVEGMRCVSCRICEKECPPQCIYIVQDKDDKGKLLKRPKVFDIDASVCMGCQICVETCPFEAIKMDSEFELSTTDRFGGLLLDRAQLLKSNSYFHRIHPDEAREVDERLEAERQKKAKAEAAKAAAAVAAKPSVAS
jgi:NADH-quinone oxidoreductase subunit I